MATAANPAVTGLFSGAALISSIAGSIGLYWFLVHGVYIPTLTTATDGMREIAVVTFITAGYLGLQVFASATRSTSSLWWTMMDIIASLGPVVVLILAWVNYSTIQIPGSVDPAAYLAWWSWTWWIVATMVIIDNVMITYLVIKLLFLADEFIRTR